MLMSAEFNWCANTTFHRILCVNLIEMWLRSNVKSDSYLPKKFFLICFNDIP